MQLNAHLDKVEARRDQSNWIVNSPSTLEATRRYFAKQRDTRAARAGLRFLVVTADGALQPCSMQFHHYPARRAHAHDPRIHQPKSVRRVLRVHPLLPGQELSAIAVGERERVLLLKFKRKMIGILLLGAVCSSAPPSPPMLRFRSQPAAA